MASFTRQISRLGSRLGLAPAQGLFGEYAADYAVIAGAAFVWGMLNDMTPRAAYIPKEQVAYMNFPLLKDTVSHYQVHIVGVAIPATVFIAYSLLSRKPGAFLHHLLLGLLTSYLVTAAITICLKIPVGELRPDFNARCWPDGDIQWERDDALGGYPLCSGEPKHVAEGRRSFPSGHSSRSSSGLVFLTLFLWDILAPIRGATGHSWRLLVAVTPAASAFGIGVTRYMDYWHHWYDVLAGLFLGSLVAALSYRLQQTKLARVEAAAAASGPSATGRRGAGDLEAQQPLLGGR